MKSLLLLLICAWTAEAFAETPFVLEGRISGKESGLVYLRYNRHGFSISDSARLQNNRFRFDGMLDGPIRGSLTYRADANAPGKSLYTDFYFEPGNLTVDINWNKPDQTRMQGSTANNEYDSLKSLSDPLLANLYRVRREVLAGAGKSDSLRYFQTEVSSTLVKFMAEYPASVSAGHAAARLIQAMELSVDSALALMHSLAPVVQQSEFCRQSIAGFTQTANSVIGHAAPVFTRTDLSGKKFSLADMNFLKTHANMYDASFNGELRKLYNLLPIPTEILIDKEGIIIGRYGGQDADSDTLPEQLRRTLKK